jgi:hypothetical protein
VGILVDFGVFLASKWLKIAFFFEKMEKKNGHLIVKIRKKKAIHI